MYCISIFLILLVFINCQEKPHVIDNVPFIDQTEKYPTGCESISTMMCLKYWEIDITPEQFIDNYLDKGIFYYKNGQLHAPHPSDKFVGSPYDPASYGCYEPVIERALNKLISERKENFNVVDLTNVEMDIIKSDYIDKDYPVIFWATMYMSDYTMGNMWIVPETGEKFQWRGREHCLILIGYDDNNYIFNDPMMGKEYPYPKERVEKCHKDLYSMAVALVPKT